MRPPRRTSLFGARAARRYYRAIIYVRRAASVGLRRLAELSRHCIDSIHRHNAQSFLREASWRPNVDRLHSEVH